jgi:hypothetical protein
MLRDILQTVRKKNVIAQVILSIIPAILLIEAFCVRASNALLSDIDICLAFVTYLAISVLTGEKK